MNGLTVLDVGALTLLQDAGRPGRLHLGVPPGGPADRASAAQGRRLVGNPDDGAGLEVLLTGVRLRAEQDVVLAVTGAPASVTVDGQPAAFGSVLSLPAGGEVVVGPTSHGLRSYVAVRGGLVATDELVAELGSLSSSPAAHLGPRPLSAGDVLHVGDDVGEPHIGLTVPAVDAARDIITLECSRGPRADWLTPAALERFTQTHWLVSNDTDRVGVRLEGEPLELARHEQLPSEGLLRGAVQVPPSGCPVVFGPDHPATGGYPVVAVVDDDAVDRLLQQRPGTAVRLRLRG